jgi:hypothetical protein
VATKRRLRHAAYRSQFPLGASVIDGGRMRGEAAELSSRLGLGKDAVSEVKRGMNWKKLLQTSAL